MTIELTEIYTALFDALEALDQQLDGFGLYAIREYQKKAAKLHPPLVQEWTLAIRPTLQQLGDPVLGQPGRGVFQVTLADQRRVGLKFLNLSSVKVRKYGSQHRIDPYQDYSARWETIDWEKWLWSLWKAHWGYFERGGFDIRGILLIGFDDKADPLGKEITALQQAVDWEKHGAHYQSRQWPDRYGRAIWVRLSAWSFEAGKPTP
ncbi:MAG: hypothetical protein NT075_30820 [Chloroflexi bacterium]|nr:hypothetical protein [Chloroflexota bacterium]